MTEPADDVASVLVCRHGDDADTCEICLDEGESWDMRDWYEVVA